MTETLGEVIQSVQSMYSRGLQSVDSRLSSRHIYSELKRSRADVIIQKSNKNQPIVQWAYQTIDCVELVLSSPFECPCITDTGCMVLRSKYKFPTPLTAISGDLIQSITSLDGDLSIDKTTFATHKYAKGNKFTSKKPRFYFYNEYLFITVLKRLEVVSVSLLAEDFIEAWQYPSACEDCEDCCVDIYERPFPLDSQNIKTVVLMTSERLINTFLQMQKDNNSDAMDNIGTVNMIH